MRAENRSRVEVEPGWAMLFRVAAVSAFVTIAITVIQIIVFAVAPPPTFQPTPAATSAIFDLIRSSPVLGLVELDGLMLLDYVLIAVVFVALYGALRRDQPALALLGLALALVAITAYFSVNPAASMLVLAGQQPVASTVAAGQAVLANFRGSGFIVHYLLMGMAGLLISAAMLRGPVFSRTTALAGMLQGAMMLVPSTFGTVGLIFALASLAPFVVWFILIGLRLRRLASDSSSA